jgi:hypothetical protein
MTRYVRERAADVDLGLDHRLFYCQWAPDRDLNPQYEGVPDVARYAAIIEHLNPAGEPCAGCVTFDGDVARQIEPPTRHMWQVEQADPLTISPSVLCQCGDHGFIRDGLWVPA